MLNEVYVFGYFHADLHPANMFVLPGDAIGYVDFGIVGQLPEPGPRIADPIQLAAVPWRHRGRDPRAHALALTRPDDGRERHQVAVDPRPPGILLRHGRGPDAHRGARSTRNPAENPYSKLAVDIMETIRDHELTLSPSIVPT